MNVATCLQGLPRTLKIGAYDWAVVVIDGEHDLCGQAVFAEDQIRLWPANITTPGHAVGIVLHECYHVIYHNESLRTKRLNGSREEAIVAGFEIGTISLLRDNPKLLTWMKRWLGANR
ncbi:hypothetical protein [Bradyrhizobium sp. Tv2a-2]|uniref:hypothetical protein n=1 Tax=Bradyrhizobium sp. Tv2a-2 TaxID=113395 RepID=UPI000424EB26|nr:hypothetical protein [Bradyrhizobium sp. Tv2a-2]